jgi:hypothetical protein
MFTLTAKQSKSRTSHPHQSLFGFYSYVLCHTHYHTYITIHFQAKSIFARYGNYTESTGLLAGTSNHPPISAPTWHNRARSLFPSRSLNEERPVPLPTADESPHRGTHNAHCAHRAHPAHGINFKGPSPTGTLLPT